VLGGLGATMVVGYLAEAHVRRRLRRSNYDAMETPLAVVAIGLSVAMAVLGLRSRKGNDSDPGARVRRG
jgi:hypothetical protein